MLESDSAKIPSDIIYKIFMHPLIIEDERKLDENLRLEQVKCNKFLKIVIVKSEEGLFTRPVLIRLSDKKVIHVA